MYMRPASRGNRSAPAHSLTDYAESVQRDAETLARLVGASPAEDGPLGMERLATMLFLAVRSLTKAEETVAGIKASAAAEIDRVKDDFAGLASGMARVQLADDFDPRGWFVYSLFEDGSECPIYIGSSGNILARLGTHLMTPDRMNRIARYTLIRCKSRNAMLKTEAAMIRRLKPELNITHNRVA